MFTQQFFNRLRVKELILFCMGFAFSELKHVWGQQNPKKIIDFTSKLTQMTENFINKYQQLSYSVNRQNLSLVFEQVLNSLEERIQQLKLSFEELFQIFLTILEKGLQISELNGTIVEGNSQFKSIIHWEIEKKSSKIITLEQQKHSMKEQPQKCEKIIESVEKPHQNVTQLCEICYLPFNCDQNHFRMDQCGHTYHQQCIFEMIGHYMNQNSSILKNQTIFLPAKTQNLTILKCPGFQKCSVHFSFNQLHIFLLNFQQKKSLQYIQRLQSMAFNDYVNSRNIMPFDKTKQFLLKDSKQSNSDACLFFCQTKGCNAIYEIDKKLARLTLQNSSKNTEIQNFICLSCQESYCLKCFSTIHPTMNCKQNAISSSYLPEDRELEKFIKTLRRPYMKCPKCSFYVDNWRGCSTITCRCGIRFCYKCGSTECPYAKCLKEIAKDEKMNEGKQEKEK